MNSLSLDIRLRPLRIGFLVDPEDRAAVSRVVRLAACLWGGTACPLIPVMVDIPERWRGHLEDHTATAISRIHLRFFEPDIFVETEWGQMSVATGDGDAFSISERRIWDLPSLLDVDSDKPLTLPFGAWMDDVYDHLHQTTFQFKRHEEHRVLAFDGGDRVGGGFFEAAYGMFPEGDRSVHFRQAYGLLGATQVPTDVNQWRLIESGSGSCPFDYTEHTISTPRPDFHSAGTSVFVFDPLSAPDVIDFWNFRLVTPSVRPVNVHWLSQCRDTLHSLLASDRMAEGHDRLVPPPRIHLAGSVNIEQALDALGLPASAVTPYEPFWAKLRRELPRPEIALLSAKHRQAQAVAIGETRPFAEAPVLSPDFPTQFRGSGPTWVNVVRPRYYSDRHRFAGALPSAALNERPRARTRPPPSTRIP